MLTLSQASIIEKNKTATDGVWLMLVELETPSGEVIRLVNNNENITHKGHEYIAFPFSVEDISEDGKQLPNVKLSVSNVTGVIQGYLEDEKGLGGAKAHISIINTNIKDVTEVEEFFIVTGSSADSEWVVFTLGTDFSFTRRYPPVRIMKDYCPFKFKSIECGYNGTETACNKTLGRCRELNNSLRFGGEPSIPQGGLYASNNI